MWWVTCDGVLGKEAKVQYNSTTVKNLAGSLVKKSGKSYSVTSNFMKSRMRIAIIRGKPNIYCRRPRIAHPHFEPNEPTYKHPKWGGGAGLSLFYVRTMGRTTNILKIEQKVPSEV